MCIYCGTYHVHAISMTKHTKRGTRNRRAHLRGKGVHVWRGGHAQQVITRGRGGHPSGACRRWGEGSTGRERAWRSDVSPMSFSFLNLIHFCGSSRDIDKWCVCGQARNCNHHLLLCSLHVSTQRLKLKIVACVQTGQESSSSKRMTLLEYRFALLAMNPTDLPTACMASHYDLALSLQVYLFSQLIIGLSPRPVSSLQVIRLLGFRFMSTGTRSLPGSRCSQKGPKARALN